MSPEETQKAESLGNEGQGGGCFVKGIDTEPKVPQVCKCTLGTMDRTRLTAGPLNFRDRLHSALLSPLLLFLKCGNSQNLKHEKDCLCVMHSQHGGDSQGSVGHLETCRTLRISS